jgi:THO complex subunit 1
MVLLDFLLSLTPAAKEKGSQYVNINRGVQYAFTLNEDNVSASPSSSTCISKPDVPSVQEAWAFKTKEQISQSLQPNTSGKLFMRLINTVLAREQNWVQWKVEGCHGFDLAPLPSSEFQDAKAKAALHCKSERPFPYSMGTPTLHRLWKDTGDHLQIEDLEDDDRLGPYPLPSVPHRQLLTNHLDGEYHPLTPSARASTKTSKISKTRCSRLISKKARTRSRRRRGKRCG